MGIGRLKDMSAIVVTILMAVEIWKPILLHQSMWNLKADPGLRITY